MSGDEDFRDMEERPGVGGVVALLLSIVALVVAVLVAALCA